MKIETQPLENRQVKIIAEFEPETLETYQRKAVRKIANQVKVPGFRPGKAPADMIRRMYGEQAILQEAIEMLIDDQYSQVLDEAEIKPSGPGSLEEIISQDPVKLAFVVPLEPEIKLGDYHAIQMPYQLEETTDEEVDEFIQRLRRNYATAEPVEGRPAEAGDLVYVKIRGVDTSPAEESEADLFPERPAQFLIGDTDQVERNWPFPGFSDQLAGLNEGEEKTIRHTFAADEADEALQGKDVEFTVNVQSIKRLNLPELDDDFATTLGQFESFAELRQAVREQLQQSKQNQYDDTYYDQLLDQIVEQSTVEFPDHMVEHEIEHMLEHLNQDLGRQGLDFDAYLKMLDKDRETYLEEEVRPAARKRLSRSLALQEIARQENVRLSEEDFQSAYMGTQQQLAAMPRQGKKDRVPERMVNDLTYNVLSRVYNQRILERLKAIASGETPEASEEITQAPELALEEAQEATGGYQAVEVTEEEQPAGAPAPVQEPKKKRAPRAKKAAKPEEEAATEQTADDAEDAG